MKSISAIFWFLLSVVLAGVLVFQTKQRRAQQQRLESAQLQVEEFSNQARTAESHAQEFQKQESALRKELASTQDELSRARTQPQQLAPAKGNPATISRNSSPAVPKESGNMATVFANMMKDPEARKAMAQQQRMGLNMVYGEMFRRLGLSGDQEEKLKDLLLEQQMNNMEHAGDLFDPNGNRAEAMQKMGDAQKQLQDQIKGLLGDEKYTQFQQYSQTLGERMMLDQFGKDAEITPDQKEALLNIVLEERKNSQINNGESLTKSPEDLSKMLNSPDAMEKTIARQQQINERVIERAGNILTADQVRKLGPLLDSQLQMQRAGVKMAQEMFGRNAAPAAPVETTK
jgi:hypothetical protein